MTKLILAEEPDVLFTQWPIDTHMDHQAASTLAYRAWLAARRPFDLYYYEVDFGSQTMSFHPTDFVDITPVRLMAGQVYVIGSAFVGSQAPTFDPAWLDPMFTAIEGRLVFADAYPLRSHASFIGGGNFQFVPAP